MCGKKPKAPRPEPNYELQIQAEQSREAIAESKAASKKARLESLFSIGNPRAGRHAFFISGPGGKGFGAPRAAVTAMVSNGRMSGTGGGTGTGGAGSYPSGMGR